MIESSRRHGQFESRSTARSVHVWHFIPATANDGPSIQNWENEGGRLATTDETDVAAEVDETYRSANIPPSSPR
jgi:hypothetical protein